MERSMYITKVLINKSISNYASVSRNKFIFRLQLQLYCVNNLFNVSTYNKHVMIQAAPLGGCGAALVAGNRNIHYLRGVTNSSVAGIQNWHHAPICLDDVSLSQTTCYHLL